MKKSVIAFAALVVLGLGLFLSGKLSAQSFGTQAATVSFSSSGNNTVIAAVSGKAIRVTWLWLCVAGASNITIVEVRPSTNSGAVPMAANGCMTLPSGPLNGFPLAITTPGNAFIINSSQAVQVSGAVYYDVTNI
jgi:hypothetical protein